MIDRSLLAKYFPSLQWTIEPTSDGDIDCASASIPASDPWAGDADIVVLHYIKDDTCVATLRINDGVGFANFPDDESVEGALKSLRHQMMVARDCLNTALQSPTE